MKTFFLIYLVIGLLLNLIGPLARKINDEIIRFKKEYKFRKEWGKYDVPAWKRTGYIFTLRVLGILFYPLLYFILLHDFYFSGTNKRGDRIMKSDDKMLYFFKMGGAGKASCLDCDFSEEIVSFLHGTHLDMLSDTGFQCQKCGELQVIKNDMDNSKSVKCICGGDLDRELPIFCPKCKSNNVAYRMSYIT